MQVLLTAVMEARFVKVYNHHVGPTGFGCTALKQSLHKDVQHGAERLCECCNNYSLVWESSRGKDVAQADRKTGHHSACYEWVLLSVMKIIENWLCLSIAGNLDAFLSFEYMLFSQMPVSLGRWREMRCPGHALYKSPMRDICGHYRSM